MKKFALIGCIALASACAKKDPMVEVLSAVEAEFASESTDIRSLAPEPVFEPAETEVAEEVAQKEPGFFGRIFGGRAAAEITETTPEEVFLEETGLTEGVSLPEKVDPASDDVFIPPVVAEPVVPKPGFWGRVFSKSETPADEDTDLDEPDETALFAGNRRSAERIALVDDTPLPPGVIAKVCRFSKRKLGTEVEDTAGFKLYDSDPETFAPRSHFVTGFKDGCARKFTAGMVFLGDPLLHETKRYKSTAEYSPLDEAYETVKARVCRVAKRAHCEKRTDKLVSSTVFVSIYRYFGDANSAGEILLYNGRIKASDFDT